MHDVLRQSRLSMRSHMGQSSQQERFALAINYEGSNLCWCTLGSPGVCMHTIRTIISVCVCVGVCVCVCVCV